MKNQQASRHTTEITGSAPSAERRLPPEPELPRAIDLFRHAAPWLVAGTVIVLLIVLGLRVIMAPLWQ